MPLSSLPKDEVELEIAKRFAAVRWPSEPTSVAALAEPSSGDARVSLKAMAIHLELCGYLQDDEQTRAELASNGLDMFLTVELRSDSACSGVSIQPDLKSTPPHVPPKRAWARIADELRGLVPRFRPAFAQETELEFVPDEYFHSDVMPRPSTWLPAAQSPELARWFDRVRIGSNVGAECTVWTGPKSRWSSVDLPAMKRRLTRKWEKLPRYLAQAEGTPVILVVHSDCFSLASDTCGVEVSQLVREASLHAEELIEITGVRFDEAWWFASPFRDWGIRLHQIV